MDAFNLRVLEIRPVGVLETEAVAEVIELKPHAVVGIAFELDATNFNHLAKLLRSPLMRCDFA